MATLVVRVTPPDLDEWYALHIAQVENFKKAGVTSEVMYRDRNEPGTVVGILDVEDPDRFFAWLATAAGPARYRPTIWVLDEVERTI
jgi:hypothetical protein